jgi:hypothetical protein
MLSSIKSNDNQWTVVIDSQPYVFGADHPEYSNLIECVKVGDAEEFLKLITVGTAIENWSEGSFSFRDGFLFFEGEQIADQPTKRIIELIKDGWPVAPMLAYLTNLYENGSKRAVQESYDWCSHKGIPITEDGMLVGYKGVSIHRGPEFTDLNGRTVRDGDNVDKHTGKSYRNNVGDAPSMPRRQVCDNAEVGCSSGLHVGTYEYASNWAGSNGVVVLVKFNPKDIVSVPTDCEYQKMRVSSYEVIGIARGVIESAVYKTEDEDEDEDEFGDVFGDEDGDEDEYEYENDDWN